MLRKRVLITGSSRGLGEAIKFRFSDESDLYELLTPTRSELNLTDNNSIDHYFSVVGKNFDIVINNAGINYPDLIEDITLSNWQETLQVNLTSIFKIIQKVTPHMKEKNWGRILNMSSCFSKVTKPARSLYSATKAGLDGLTRGCAVELGGNNILVNSICPGYIATDLTFQNNSPVQIEKICESIPLKRLGNPKEIAEIVYFLCSEKNTYITGQSIPIDGGFTCL
jgi:3-oxoacyl-[acyl-carrier protein] reductase